MSTQSGVKWPVMPGTYQVGDPKGPVAVCALTSEKLMAPLAAVPGVAIAGMVYTSNLGITRIIVNVTSNPAIRFLLICGRDSALFKPGQSLVALSEKGVDEKKRIIDSPGYDPVLPSVAPDQIEQFRRQVEVLDWTGEEDLSILTDQVKSLANRSPGVFSVEQKMSVQPKREEFESIRPGGQREPLIYDPKGYFVISLDQLEKEIILRHYLPDHTPAHEMRGRGATSILLGLLRDGLVTQLSHAGYLGEELAKAQTALQFGLRYDQDRPLREREKPPEKPAGQAVEEPPKPVSTHSLKVFKETVPGHYIDLFLTVTEIPRDHVLAGFFVDMDESGASRVYTKTAEKIEIEWNQESKLIMGGAEDLVSGAILRVSGDLQENNLVRAKSLVVLSRVAKLSD